MVEKEALILNPEEAALMRKYEEMAERQIRHITEQAQIPKPKTCLTYLYSPTCPHCRKIEKSLYNFVEKHPETALFKIDASTESGTNLLETVLKGEREVPTIIINDRFVVTGDRNFLTRLTYSIKLAENLPQTREENTKWLLRK